MHRPEVTPQGRQMGFAVPQNPVIGQNPLPSLTQQQTNFLVKYGIMENRIPTFMQSMHNVGFSGDNLVSFIQDMRENNILGKDLGHFIHSIQEYFKTHNFDNKFIMLFLSELRNLGVTSKQIISLVNGPHTKDVSPQSMLFLSRNLHSILPLQGAILAEKISSAVQEVQNCVLSIANQQPINSNMPIPACVLQIKTHLQNAGSFTNKSSEQIKYLICESVYQNPNFPQIISQKILKYIQVIAQDISLKKEIRNMGVEYIENIPTHNPENLVTSFIKTLLTREKVDSLNAMGLNGELTWIGQSIRYNLNVNEVRNKLNPIYQAIPELAESEYPLTMAFYSEAKKKKTVWQRAWLEIELIMNSLINQPYIPILIKISSNISNWEKREEVIASISTNYPQLINNPQYTYYIRNINNLINRLLEKLKNIGYEAVAVHAGHNPTLRNSVALSKYVEEKKRILEQQAMVNSTLFNPTASIQNQPSRETSPAYAVSLNRYEVNQLLSPTLPAVKLEPDSPILGRGQAIIASASSTHENTEFEREINAVNEIIDRSTPVSYVYMASSPAYSDSTTSTRIGGRGNTPADYYPPATNFRQREEYNTPGASSVLSPMSDRRSPSAVAESSVLTDPIATENDIHNRQQNIIHEAVKLFLQFAKGGHKEIVSTQGSFHNERFMLSLDFNDEENAEKKLNILIKSILFASLTDIIYGSTTIHIPRVNLSQREIEQCTNRKNKREQALDKFDKIVHKPKHETANDIKEIISDEEDMEDVIEADAQAQHRNTTTRVIKVLLACILPLDQDLIKNAQVPSDVNRINLYNAIQAVIPIITDFIHTGNADKDKMNNIFQQYLEPYLK